MKKTKLICTLLFCLMLLSLAFSARKVSADNGVPVNDSTFPDFRFRYYVLDQFDTNGDTVLNDSELSSVKSMDVSSRSISSLKGIEYFTSLTFLNCSTNNITSLDITKNTNLEHLLCYYNNITELDISNNDHLQMAMLWYEEDPWSEDNWKIYTYYYMDGDGEEVYYTLQCDFGVKIYTEKLEITTEPKDMLIAIDGTVKLTVAAEGSNLKYQWQYRNSANDTWKNSTMACAKTSTFSFKAAESHSGHQYRCGVSDNYRTVYTRTATVTVRPLITKQPAASTTVSVDGTVKLTIAAKGTNLKYQWQYRNSSSDSWKNSTMACAKTATFSFTATESHSGHQYRCNVSNGKGTTPTNTATVTVTPKITTQPVNASVAVDCTAKFTVAAKGTNLTYQWQYRNSSSDTWKNSTMACAKTAAFSFKAAESHSGHQYRCAVSNGKGTVYTNAATVTVRPLITTQPKDTTVSKGATVKLTVAAKGSNLTYQWQYRNSSTDTWKNSTMACAKTNTFSFTAAASHSGHQYRCNVSNGKGTTPTKVVTVTVK